MKVKSALYSEMRGQLGKQVVGSGWKGRMILRAYIIPANPDTLAQQAQRAKNVVSVQSWQTWVGTDVERLAKWNLLALSRQIGGYHLWQKYALKFDVASLSGGAAPFDNDITYTVPTDLSQMGLYYTVDDGAPAELVSKGNLSPGVDQVYEDDGLGAGLYKYYIGPSDVFNDLVGDDKKAVQCAHWKANAAAGTAPAAFCTVTA